MRYPLWAFFFVFVVPPFTAHALLTGAAQVPVRSDFAVTTMASSAPVHGIVQHVVFR